ncbi:MULTISPECIES: cell division protein FtsL [unclassified Enterococcus]|uniref:cell division protein FtsL n=1 Tax=unclassified Enterococcus TaxID=2608891 RepID=UPI00155598B1|nr:cell division protein FtsL [Enterococcus sp. MMGLQ5-2]MBS7583456.1 cell division protein FtsL [Enterococcus sp. MMGLQ5-1]NPD11316.1 cell division protein FtsL [Enterococcus sp. MMGLQ5-1]NPD36059.1 cell division protein FtsL [Enterococcus sp. MMGLQ5-2]
MVNIKEEQFIEEDVQKVSSPNVQATSKAKAYLPKLKKVSLLEKCFYAAVIITAISLAVSQLYVKYLIESTQNEINAVQTTIDDNAAKIADLKQQQNELLRSDRVKQIAENAGLTSNTDNLRKLN